MNAYYDEGSSLSRLYAQLSEQRLEQEREKKRREEELRRSTQAQPVVVTPVQQARPESGGMGGGMDPSTMMQMFSSQGGAGGGAGAGAGAGAAGGAEAGAGAGAGAAGGAGGAGAAGGAGGGSFMAGGGPFVIAAAVAAHHMWAKNKGMHDDKDGIMGRALYKDADWYQPRANSKVDGMGDEIKLASLGSSPVDLFRKDTWTEAANLAAKGGILGKALKKLF